MPRAKENLKVIVTQLTEGDERIITVTITARERDFMIPDLLSAEGAIDPYAEDLSKASKEVTEKYFQSSKDAITSLAEQKQGRQASAQARSPKQNDAGKGAKPKLEIRPEETAAAPGSGGVPERIIGGGLGRRPGTGNGPVAT